jgi:uncharacterized protein DUF1523
MELGSTHLLRGERGEKTLGAAMAEFSKKRKIKVILAGIAVCILMLLYSYFVADTITTRITDAQMMKVDGKFMIATEDRPFVNFDAKWRFKFNSGTVQNDAIKLRGKLVKIKKYGWRIPIFSQYENVVKIEEVK